MAEEKATANGSNAVPSNRSGGTSNRDWCEPVEPEDPAPALVPVRSHGQDFNYAEAFNSLDLAAVKKDFLALMTTSQDWCRRTLATMGLCSFAWPGIARARIAPATVAAAPEAASSASLLSTAGLTTSA